MVIEKIRDEAKGSKTNEYENTTYQSLWDTAKRPPIEWEKIFSSCISDKRLMTRIYREFKKLKSPQINEPIKK
jgi:hypothetical protein